MKKGIKVTLNLLAAGAIGYVSYRIGFKKGKDSMSQWAADEINKVIEQECKAIETAKVNEKPAEPDILDEHILKQLEYGKGDELVIEPNKEPIMEEPSNEPVLVSLKTELAATPDVEPATKRKSRKVPYLVTSKEYDEDDRYAFFDRTDLEVTADGDLYLARSDNLYDERELVGERLINRMIKDRENNIGEWWVINEPNEKMFDISFRASEV